MEPEGLVTIPLSSAWGKDAHYSYFLLIITPSTNRSSAGSNKKIIYGLTKCYIIFPSYLIHSEEK